MRRRRVGLFGSLFFATFVALALGAPSAVSADTVGPSFSAHAPAQGAVLSAPVYGDWEDYYGHIPISVTVTDPDGIPDQTWGGSVKAGGYNFGFYPTVTRINANTVLLSQDESFVQDGTYQVTASGKDSLGNSGTTSWSFALDTVSPVVSSFAPIMESWKANDPIIVDFTDSTTGVSPGSVVMTVDGTAVSPTVSVSGTVTHVTYVPLAQLALGTHAVRVSCVDGAGHPATKSWTFDVVPANAGPRADYDSMASGFQYMTGGYWLYDEGGVPIQYVPTSVSHTLRFIDADIIDRNSLVWKVSDSTNTTTRTVTPSITWGTGDQSVVLSTAHNGVTDGQVFHTRITLSDKLGAVRVYDRTFMAYRDAPYDSGQQPAPGVHQSLARPTIQVTFRDASAGIDAGSIDMRVDGMSVPVTTAPVEAGYLISGVPTVDLGNGEHTVVVSVKDGVGVPASSTWSFFVDLPAPPTFTEISPGNLGVVDADWGSGFGAQVFDADGLLAGSQRLTLTFPSGETRTVPATLSWDYAWLGTPWEHNYARLGYSLPLDTPEGGPIVVDLSIEDMTGMRGSRTWMISYLRDEPRYYDKTPASSGVTTSTEPVISARVTDSSGIDPDSVRAYLDGVEVACELAPVSGGYVVSHRGTRFDVRTSHEFKIYAEDTAGWHTPEPGWAEDAPAWTFYVAVEPQPSGLQPAAGSTTSTDCPTISASFDEFDGLKPATAALSIDGKSVSPTVSVSDANRHAVLSYSTRLSPGVHTIQAQISSTKGVPGIARWSITVPGLPEMPYLDNAYDACVACHAYPTNTERRISYPQLWRDHPTSRAFDDVHDATLQDGYHNNQCQKCHSKMTLAGKTNCDICHILVGGVMGIPADGYRLRDGEHGNTFGYTYLDRSTPGRYTISSPRRWDDCLYCHQVQTSFAPTAANHDMTQGHTVEFPDASCAQCHDRVLTREHAKTSAVDGTGAGLTCASCHGSQDATVAAVSLGAPTFRFASDATGFEPTVTDPTWMDHTREFSVPGGQITAFTLSVRASYATSYTVEAWYGGRWMHVSYTRIAAGYSVNLTNYANGNNYLAKPTTVKVTLPGPTDKVRLGIRTYSGMGYSYRKNVEARITNVVSTRPKATCSSCHADGHPHPEADLSAVANGARTCSACHSSDIVAEHAKPTSAGHDDPCGTCHRSGGPREAMRGSSWNGECDTAVCHGAQSGRPVHANYCLACHDESQADFAVAKTAFPAVPQVDRETACKACHAPGLVGTHPYHQSGANCGAACHPGWGNALISATPGYTDPTSGASFVDATSKSTDPARLHTIHAAVRWPAGVSTAASACASCHAVTACNTCHAGAIPATHGSHSSSDQVANPAWTGTIAHGVVAGDQTQRTAYSDANQCGSVGCHDVAGAAANGPHAVEDYNYTVGGNPDEPGSANTAIAQVGTWRYRSSVRYTGGRMSYANVAGSSLSATVTGERVEILSDRDPYRGVAEVYVDGVASGTFDAYSSTTRFQAVVFSADLAPGVHTISVRPTGTKCASSRGSYVVVDAFRVYSKTPVSKVPACTGCHEDRIANHW